MKRDSSESNEFLDCIWIVLPERVDLLFAFYDTIQQLNGEVYYGPTGLNQEGYYFETYIVRIPDFDNRKSFDFLLNSQFDFVDVNIRPLDIGHTSKLYKYKMSDVSVRSRLIAMYTEEHGLTNKQKLQGISEQSPLISFEGITESMVAPLINMGIVTIEDLLEQIPKHTDWDQCAAALGTTKENIFNILTVLDSHRMVSFYDSDRG
jgi:hypothetical protein